MADVQPAPWFEASEIRERVKRIQARLAEDRQDALLAFFPESVTWSTGFFTRGYSSFQFAIIPVDGDPVIVCRDVEAYYLDLTCVFPGRVLWTDSDDKTRVARDAITSVVGQRRNIAIEMFAWPLSVGRFDAMKTALPDINWSDGSGIISGMRLIKSPAEVEYQRRAARAAEAGMEAGVAAAVEGATEREMAAGICAAMIRAGSDRPGPGVLSSGERALHLHGGYTDRVLERGDIVQLETTPHVRHYHARFMRPIKVAEATDDERDTVDMLIRIQDAAIAEVRPGVPATVPDQVNRQGVLEAGLKREYTNKTFYSVGLLIEPTGGEPLEAHPEATWTFEPGMTFHTYVLARGFGMSETILVTPDGCERLTRFPRKLFMGGQ
jgi:Xaa-Pro dipeptidase